ncbi:hypothetical protein DMN91_007990 [Ooceraea biroi]|uniref:Uncharacterized protein n=1 Tax=Ooceraea biroi TaxID=2015173 RepID=A0A3L8DGY0_OOCBI|nr:hypothetical protein DMN91_007990 [Ooceraea biroi]
MPVERSPIRMTEPNPALTPALGVKTVSRESAGDFAFPRDNTPGFGNDETSRDHHDDSRVNEVRSVKLPRPFWYDNAARYFTVAEMTFALHRITSDETKFRHIVINLDGYDSMILKRWTQELGTILLERKCMWSKRMLLIGQGHQETPRTRKTSL